VVLSLRRRDSCGWPSSPALQASSAWRHILPNVINSAVVRLLGVVSHGSPLSSSRRRAAAQAWGLMMADGKKGLMVGYWWLTVLPGICIMLMVLSANLLGDWLRVKLDPQLRQL
jgi:peptide/nickel transport system permease protein